ncbi:MAG: hypothetical protein J0M00_06975 [Burkholderiales bacterium]|nr:hypothetical protein [Burkholderiales bacterium]
MSSTKKSAGGRAATDSATQSGVPPSPLTGEPLAVDTSQQPRAGCFGLECADLHVHPGSSAEAVNFSALCLVGSGVAILDAIADSLNNEALYGALYLLRQAKLVLDNSAGGPAHE